MWLLATLAFPCAFISPANLSQQENDRPNIVLILADDLGWTDLSCQGSDFYETPHLDALAASGVRFLQGYANGPNCAPTRAALMSGQYAPRTGVYTVGSGARGAENNRRLHPVKNRTALDLKVVTLAEALRSAGYRTGFVGKWHLGGNQASPQDQGFDFAIAGNHLGHPPSYFYPYERKQKSLPGLEEGKDGEYLTDRLTEEALRFLDSTSDQPYFLLLSHYAVHTPIQSKPSWKKHFADKQPQEKHRHAAYAGMIASLDESVGLLRKHLKDSGQLENTLVIFTSDNGGLGGYQDAGVPGSPEITHQHPLRGGKGMLYEGGIRVPWIFSWPSRIHPRIDSDSVIATIDLYPTLFQMAKGTKPAGHLLDGLSLWPALLEKSHELIKRPLYWHFPGYLESQRQGKTWRATPTGVIRQGRYKLLEFFESGRLELYDLHADPGETHDLSAELPEATKQLHRSLGKWRQKLGAPLPVEKQEPVPTQTRGHFHYDAAPTQVPARKLGGPTAYDPDLVSSAAGWLATWLEYTPEQGDAVQIRDVESEANSAVQVVVGGRMARPSLTTLASDHLWLSVERQESAEDTWGIWASRFAPQSMQWEENPLRIDADTGNAIRHQVAAGLGDDLWFAWMVEQRGQFEIFVRRLQTKTRTLGPLHHVSKGYPGAWHPALTVTPDGAVCVAWDTHQNGSFDVYARWFAQDAWQPIQQITRSKAFEARVQIAPSSEGSVWILWEQGAENWGAPFRGKNKQWNNVTDAYGPIHRFRRLHFGRLDRSGNFQSWKLPQPALDNPNRTQDKRAEVTDLGIFYERGKLIVDRQNRPWLCYRHYADHQLGREEDVVHHIEEGWKLYARQLDPERGWSALFSLKGHQRDGNQRLSLATGKDGIGAIWSVGRTDRDGKEPQKPAVLWAQLPSDFEPQYPAIRQANQQVESPAVQQRPRQRPEFDGMQLFYGDLHRHTDLSLCFPFFDGSIDDAYRYAIEVAELDFLGITDHTRDIDRGNVQSLLWWRACKEVVRHRLGETFIPYFAYERSHRDTDHNVISLHPHMLRPFPPPLPEFWAEMDTDTLTIPHNPFIGKVWDYQDDDKRPLLEIYQGLRDMPEHGPKHAHDGLSRGYHLGFIASSDHMSTNASFACVWADKPEREPLFRALQARRTYGATAKIELVFQCGSHWMGEQITVSQNPHFSVKIRGTASILWMDVYHDGKKVRRISPQTRGPEWATAFSIEQSAGVEHYTYVHIMQEDGNQAWSSPIWVTVNEKSDPLQH